MRALLALVAALLLAAPSAAAAPPEVDAPAAIAVEAYTGDVVYERAADERRAIASATKLMTALLALENARAGDEIPAAEYDAGPLETVVNLRPGERMTVADLLRALLMHSANDAAVTLAAGIGGSQNAFVRMMNRRARELGLSNTHFANPVGLDDRRNYSSARDLVKLTLRLRRFEFFRKVVNRTVATLESGDRARTIRNRNLLVHRETWINGVKTGRTEAAGYVLVGSGRQRGVQVVSVVLGAPSEAARLEDTLDLLEFAASRYRVARPLSRGRELARVPIRYRRGAELPLLAGAHVREVVRRGGPKARISLRGVPDEVEGPIARGQRFGTVVVRRGGKVVAEVPLVASAGVPAADLAQRTKDYFTRPFTLLLVVAVVGCSVLLARMRRNGVRERRRGRGSEPKTA